ncbi:MAG: hypothetical protein ACRD1R_03585 [Acidobacteriota bacterium]
MTAEEKERDLIARIGRFQSAIIAFSGGVDSSYLAFIANRVLGERARAVTAISPSVSEMQKELASGFARRHTSQEKVAFDLPPCSSRTVNERVPGSTKIPLQSAVRVTWTSIGCRASMVTVSKKIGSNSIVACPLTSWPWPRSKK